MNMTVLEMQRLLRMRGFDPGPSDGIKGPQTDAALIAFKQSVGLRARAYLGPITQSALRKGITPAPSHIEDDGKSIRMQTWLRLAYSHLGLREIPGSRHNAQIISWWEKLKLPFRDDETPWCAGFGNGMVQEAGFPIVSRYRAAALGWRWEGYGTRLLGPALGAFMSMKRPGKPGSGHMTIVAGRDANGNIMGLGGNQGNMVSINPYHPTNRDAQYHWPEGAALPNWVGMTSLPLINSAGSKLTNEA